MLSALPRTDVSVAISKRTPPNRPCTSLRPNLIRTCLIFERAAAIHNTSPRRAPFAGIPFELVALIQVAQRPAAELIFKIDQYCRL